MTSSALGALTWGEGRRAPPRLGLDIWLWRPQPDSGPLPQASLSSHPVSVATGALWPG